MHTVAAQTGPKKETGSILIFKGGTPLGEYPIHGKSLSEAFAEVREKMNPEYGAVVLGSNGVIGTHNLKPKRADCEEIGSPNAQYLFLARPDLCEETK